MSDGGICRTIQRMELLNLAKCIVDRAILEGFCGSRMRLMEQVWKLRMREILPLSN